MHERAKFFDFVARFEPKINYLILSWSTKFEPRFQKIYVKAYLSR